MICSGIGTAVAAVVVARTGGVASLWTAAAVCDEGRDGVGGDGAAVAAASRANAVQANMTHLAVPCSGEGSPAL
ncbi:hypothetical protein SB85_06285 [Xanthomonas sacchari]|nr:hypothetical protein SB85_06285 [Xanthomonas sacchari]KAB7774674.1 hypothetical protein CEK66_18735 [Xanthomonas sp. LMG 12460]